MQAIIFADRRGKELAPLCPDYTPALLPVGNKPLLQYSVEELATAGITEILLVVSHQVKAIRQQFGTGELWGVHIDYLLSRGEEDPQDVLLRLGSRLELPCLVLRGDIYRPATCGQFLERADEFALPLVSASVNGLNAGMSLLRSRATPPLPVRWPMPECAGGGVIDLPGQRVHALRNPVEFHRACLQAISDAAGGASPAVRELSPGLYAEARARVQPHQHDSGLVHVGENALIGYGARLCGPCLIGADCYIDRGASVHNSVVLPGTYVGQNLEVENAIVLGNRLVRVDHGIEVTVDDPVLLSDMASEISGMAQQWPQRALALTMILLAAPLWLLGLILSLLNNPTAPLVTSRLVSNRRSVTGSSQNFGTATAWRFATTVPLLRHLPLLWLVWTGDLRLFGTRPLCPQRLACQPDEHRLRRPMGGFGLLGPAQLLLPGSASEEEILVHELEFAERKGAKVLLARLARAATLLFRARAWNPAVSGRETGRHA